VYRGFVGHNYINKTLMSQAPYPLGGPLAYDACYGDSARVGMGWGKDTRRDLHAVQVFCMGEDTTMTVRELRAALTSMEANSDVQVVLFKNDGTSKVFELEEVLSNNGHAQLEIYEDEPVREENPEG
jgi:hypothetical protein